jgi:glutamyl-tRNA synthetase
MNQAPHNPGRNTPYRGRLAPTPSGHLHIGHARTFWTAFERARHGTLVMRMEDLDAPRCRPDYAWAAQEDLRWLGIEWHEGPELGGPHAPYHQRDRLDWYLEVWRRLAAAGAIYPSPHSRSDVERALRAPHADEEGEPVFPPELRPVPGSWEIPAPDAGAPRENWRFRVPDGESIRFTDELRGGQCFVAGRDFGDFLVWRRDGFPSYELAVVADDHAMAITEVVRGEDLLLSTARQILLYRALGWAAPAFCHCPLVRDAEGRRLAKRAGAVSLRELRSRGLTPDDVRAMW